MTRTLIVLMLVAGVASADDQPWAKGVSAEHKAAAKKLLDAGNTLFLERQYAEALKEYEKAVAEWDHPAIRFNIVRCLIQLDRSDEAMDNLQRALQYGSAPLEEGVYTEALAYQKLLANQSGDVEVKCEQTGVAIRLDGQPFLTCPGTKSKRLKLGSHQIVGTEDGFLTKTMDVVVNGGGSQSVSLSLMPLAKAGKIEHRYATWMPWVVFGSGLATVGVGGMLELFSSSKMADYDSAVSRDCAVTGCPPGDPRLAADDHLRQTARTYNAAAIGVLSIGAAATAAGAVLLYLNRGRTIYPEQVVPAPIPGGAAVTVRGSF